MYFANARDILDAFFRNALQPPFFDGASQCDFAVANLNIDVAGVDVWVMVESLVHVLLYAVV